MVDPISSNIPSVSKISAPSQASTKPPAQAEATPVKADLAKSDTVELSQEAQAQLLRQQGISIPQIALQLKLDVKTVTSFFPQST
jgi:DNA-binding NarL/FixJ family response regulator